MKNNSHVKPLIAAISLYLLLQPLVTSAETTNSAGFAYLPGPISMIHATSKYEAPVLGWNVVDKRMGAPGVKVVFWGGARGCDAGLKNGPVAESMAFAPEKLKELVGIPSKKIGQRIYSPSGKSDQCSKEVQDSKGPSFALIDESEDNGAIALYTQSASVGSGNNDNFFGSLAMNANTNIGNDKNQGSFITFRFDWRGSNQDAISVWGGGDTGKDSSAMISSVQTVEILDARRAGSSSSSGEFAQAKQELIFTVVNYTCAAREKSPSKPCLLQYAFNIAVDRSGVSDWSKLGWANTGNVMLDRSQNGIPVLFGPVKSSGEPTNFAGYKDMTLWISRCAPTQHDTFRDQHFCIEIPRQALINGLRVVTAKLNNSSIVKIGDSDIAARFGSRWNDMSEWRLVAITFGQEIYNATEGATARIGGNLKSLEVRRAH